MSPYIIPHTVLFYIYDFVSSYYFLQQFANAVDAYYNICFVGYTPLLKYFTMITLFSTKNNAKCPWIADLDIMTFKMALEKSKYDKSLINLLLVIFDLWQITVIMISYFMPIVKYKNIANFKHSVWCNFGILTFAVKANEYKSQIRRHVDILY